MLERLKSMLIKEFIQVFRDPRMRLIIFIVPLFQTVVFGYAVNTDVRDIRTAVYDLDNTPESRDLAARFGGSGYFHVVEYVHGDTRVRELIDHSAVKAVLRMNRGFGATLRAGREAPLQIILDGTDSNTAGIVLSYAAKIAASYNDRLRIEQAARRFGPAFRAGGVGLESRAWFNENLESRNFFVPGIIAMLVMLVTVILTSMAVVREKEVGTIEQLLVSPITPAEFILGKTLPFAIIGYVDVLLVSFLGVFWFDVPIRGSVLLLLLSTTFYLMTTLGIGLLISTACRTQQQALMTVFLVFFPFVLLSGFMFPVENMPRSVQYLTWVNPLRYFLVILRGIFLKGAGVEILWPQMAALLGMGASLLAAATLRFRKTAA